MLHARQKSLLGERLLKTLRSIQHHSHHPIDMASEGLVRQYPFQACGRQTIELFWIQDHPSISLLLRHPGSTLKHGLCTQRKAYGFHAPVSRPGDYEQCPAEPRSVMIPDKLWPDIKLVDITHIFTPSCGEYHVYSTHIMR